MNSTAVHAICNDVTSRSRPHRQSFDRLGSRERHVSARGYRVWCSTAGFSLARSTQGTVYSVPLVHHVYLLRDENVRSAAATDRGRLGGRIVLPVSTGDCDRAMHLCIMIDLQP